MHAATHEEFKPYCCMYFILAPDAAVERRCKLVLLVQIHA